MADTERRKRQREKRWARIELLLEPGETIQVVIPAQSGVNPNMGCLPYFSGFALITVWNKRLVLVMTDRAVVVMKRRRYGILPRTVVTRLPRQTVLAPIGGSFLASGLVNIPNMRVYVNSRDRKYVEMADRIARSIGGQAGGSNSSCTGP